jgi:hypothetical protein
MKFQVVTLSLSHGKFNYLEVIMSDKIEVKVFGIRDQEVSCCCSGGDCGPTQTTGEMYDEFVEYVSTCELKDQVETQFIDIFSDGLESYPQILEAMNRGLKLPLTAVGGRLRFAGGISNSRIHQAVSKILNK